MGVGFDFFTQAAAAPAPAPVPKVVLLPAALLASVAETVARRFMSAGATAVYIQWGLLIAFAVTMCLTVVFHYGVQLQKESDETL